MSTRCSLSRHGAIYHSGVHDSASLPDWNRRASRCRSSFGIVRLWRLGLFPATGASPRDITGQEGLVRFPLAFSLLICDKELDYSSSSWPVTSYLRVGVSTERGNTAREHCSPHLLPSLPFRLYVHTPPCVQLALDSLVWGGGAA